MAALPKKVRSCIATYDTNTALCLAHCKVAGFLSGWRKRGSEGLQFCLGGAVDAAFIGKDPIEEQASRIRRKREASGPLWSNGFGRGS